MKISELIEELNSHLLKHGDIPVALYDWAEGYSSPSKSAINKDSIYVDETFREHGVPTTDIVLIIGWN